MGTIERRAEEARSGSGGKHHRRFSTLGSTCHTPVVLASYQSARVDDIPSPGEAEF